MSTHSFSSSKLLSQIPLVVNPENYFVNLKPSSLPYDFTQLPNPNQFDSFIKQQKVDESQLNELMNDYKQLLADMTIEHSENADSSIDNDGNGTPETEYSKTRKLNEKYLKDYQTWERTTILSTAPGYFNDYGSTTGVMMPTIKSKNQSLINEEEQGQSIRKVHAPKVLDTEDASTTESTQVDDGNDDDEADGLGHHELAGLHI